MNFRKIVSLSIALSFIVLATTGILSYFKAYSREIATLHTVFGVLFTFGVLLHLKNNFKPLKIYVKDKVLLLILLLSSLFFGGAYFQISPFDDVMDFGARQKASTKKELNHSDYEIIKMNTNNDIEIVVDLLRSEHYWHPQMAIWTEDTLGNFIETIFVSKATAKGLFVGGRNKENFKSFDEKKAASRESRRVNALPIWSHKRGVVYPDGMFVPTREDPLPDAISAATILDNFKLHTSVKVAPIFNLKIEINVAFDDNEYYSAFDFPDDKVYHNGTGQLGQPSILFSTQIDMDDNKNYYLMELIGHGHHSAQTGEIYKDLSKLTTALKIVERIVVGVESKQD